VKQTTINKLNSLYKAVKLQIPFYNIF